MWLFPKHRFLQWYEFLSKLVNKKTEGLFTHTRAHPPSQSLTHTKAHTWTLGHGGKLIRALWHWTGAFGGGELKITETSEGQCLVYWEIGASVSRKILPPSLGHRSTPQGKEFCKRPVFRPLFPTDSLAALVIFHSSRYPAASSPPLLILLPWSWRQ